MASKTKNPAPLAKATGLGIVVHSQRSTLEILPLPLPEIQTNFVIRRMRLSPLRARLVAELAFDRRAA